MKGQERKRGIFGKTVEPMLRLIAGLIVMLSVALAVFHSPYWLFLAAFVGLNLFQSAFTDWCPMVWILERLGLRRCEAEQAVDTPNSRDALDSHAEESTSSSEAGDLVVRWASGYPRVVSGLMFGVTLAIALLAGLPSLWPKSFSFLHPLKVDTDPENMLPQDEPVRVFHNQMRRELSLYDMLVVGVTNDVHPQGVFNARSLKNIYELTEYAKTLRWKDEEQPEKQVGVIEVDIIAPSTVDNIEQGGLGTVNFEWLMTAPPKNEAEAMEVREKAKKIPFLDDTLVSKDGKAIAIYLPITSKDLSYKISKLIEAKVAGFEGDDNFHITGLPVAQDTFGVEMFVQMAISAPLAMLIIFLLMLFFFRKLVLIISPLIVALVTVVSTMGLLVISGFTVHIMSSMIPIFIMPIAVLDAIHILSEFFDRYQETKDRSKTIVAVMHTLFMPMLFTSLTTIAGFASLALTPIPPVQVFGLFVAIGVALAWVWTVMFVPASVMFIPETSLANFGLQREGEEHPTWGSKLLSSIGGLTHSYARPLLLCTAILFGLSLWGMSRIVINDNPTKWFEARHPIRVADRVLNEHFGGTYMAYLALQAGGEEGDYGEYRKTLAAKLEDLAVAQSELPGLQEAVEEAASRLSSSSAGNREELLSTLGEFAEARLMEADSDMAAAWEAVMLLLGNEKQSQEVFKEPEVLRYIAGLQTELLKTGIVGKSNSLADIVRTVHRELFLGESEAFRIPDSREAVAETLITYENSHRPQDLWHFVTPDYRTTSIWLQLRSGDNRDMSKVVSAVERYMSENPPPEPLVHRWFGQTYINVVWQEKMVRGMLESFAGSFFVVLMMMVFLFRSALWGLLSMVPLTVTIVLVYGVIGFIGKDYDMPVAVLSSLSLGLAVDYAIHFLARSREITREQGSWSRAVGAMFGEPARAISRNAIVIGVGFLPLLFAPLVPYQTVGIFIAAILLTAGVASLFILPAVLTAFESRFFPKTSAGKWTCNCGICAVIIVSLVASVALNIQAFLAVEASLLTLVSLAVVLLMMIVCCLASRRVSCRTAD